MPTDGQPDLGDLVIVLLAATLAGLRERLVADGFKHPAKLVAELGRRCHEYVEVLA